VKYYNKSAATVDYFTSRSTIFLHIDSYLLVGDSIGLPVCQALGQTKFPSTT